MWRKIKTKLISKLNIIYTPINKIKFSLNGVKYGKNINVKGLMRIHNPKGNVTIGNNTRINSADWANPIGATITNFQIVENGKLYIGDNCGISNVSITCASEIIIGNNVLLGSGVKIFDTDFHPLQSKYRNTGTREQDKVNVKSIKIKDDCFIGADTIILKGVTIGRNCVVGAGSVVVKSIPDNQIWAGNPAKFIKANL